MLRLNEDEIRDEMIMVYKPGDTLECNYLQSVLESLNIPCIIKNDTVQDVFRIQGMGLDFNPITGAIQIMVPRNRLQEAKEIINDLIDPKNMELALPEKCPSCGKSIISEIECPVCGLVLAPHINQKMDKERTIAEKVKNQSKASNHMLRLLLVIGVVIFVMYALRLFFSR